MTPEEQAAALAARLLEAHRSLRGLEDPVRRERFSRQLRVITDASKHDVARAALRLERLLGELPQQQDLDGPAAPTP